MTYGTLRGQQWDDLDDLVVAEYCALDRRIPEPVALSDERRDDSDSATEQPPEAPAAPTLADPAEQPSEETDETRLLALCRILATADDPWRLVERLAEDLPRPAAPAAEFVFEGSTAEPPDVE